MSLIEDCLLVEDVPSMRDWMISALTLAFPGAVIEHCPTVRAAQRAIDAHATPFSLAVIDLGLPDGSGIELVHRLAADMPETLCVVATIYDDDAHLYEAIAAGARGYLLKDEDTQQIAALLGRIENGEPPLTPSIARRMLEHFRATTGPAPCGHANLTPREVEVLRLIAKGLTVGEAAKLLGLTSHTVASYVKTIYSKLNVSSRAEAALEAARRGLV